MEDKPISYYDFIKHRLDNIENYEAPSDINNRTLQLMRVLNEFHNGRGDQVIEQMLRTACKKTTYYFDWKGTIERNNVYVDDWELLTKGRYFGVEEDEKKNIEYLGREIEFLRKQRDIDYHEYLESIKNLASVSSLSRKKTAEIVKRLRDSLGTNANPIDLTFDEPEVKKQKKECN